MAVGILLNLDDPAAREGIILEPTVLATIIELCKELREQEAHLWNMSYPKLCNTEGLADIGSGQFTGAVLTMLSNLQLRFESRAGPAYVACKVAFGDITSKDGEDPETWNTIEPFLQQDGDNVWVQYPQSTAPGAIGLEDLQRLYLEDREGNKLTIYYLATVIDAHRNVAIGVWDHRVVKWKDPDDPDFSNPTAVVTEYAFYHQMGFTNPYMFNIDPTADHEPPP